MRAGSLALLALGAAGCAAAPRKELGAGAGGPLRVEVAGQALDASPGGVAPEALAARVGELLHAQRPQAARRLVLRHPDAALRALASDTRPGAPDAQRATKAPNGSTALGELAALYESTLGAKSGGWDAWHALRSREPAATATLETARAELLRALAAGEIEEAAARLPLPLPRELPPDAAPAIDAARLEGILWLCAGEPARATARSEHARDSARARAYEHAECALLAAVTDTTASEASRARWDAACDAALALAERGACAPDIWERILRLRPAELAWSAPAAKRLAELAVRALHASVPDAERGLEPACALWTLVGAQRIERREPSPALLAFSRAESAASGATTRGLLRVARGEALLLAGQTDAARTVLTTEATSAAPAVARAALARLGALDLAAERPELARAWLERALELQVPGDDPGLGRLQANLALALLSLGEDARGLELLHTAQAEFERRAALEDLELALQNELEVLASTPAAAELVRRRLASVR